MNEIFTQRHENQYHLGNWTDLDVPKVRTVNHGSKSLRYIGLKIWETRSKHQITNLKLTNLQLLLKMESKILSM